MDELTEVIEAAAWLRDNSRDPDVSLAMANVLGRSGCKTVAEYARVHRNELIELFVALREMKEQIPDSELHSAQAKSRKT